MNNKNEQKTQSEVSEVEKILIEGKLPDIRALFAFDSTTDKEDILIKFSIWARWFFPKYFKTDDAPFHTDIDTYNLATYQGTLQEFVDVVFRGGAKTTRTKLFVAFVIANDTDHFRKYLKILTKDIANSKQIVTDVYNMFINEQVRLYYPEIFEKTVEKREETMASFTTATGVKVRAGTVGTEQRGQLQEDARPDWIWMDDFETRKTLRSAVETVAIHDNMEEARTGLAKNGSCVYTCNYISERGNVHKLVQPREGRKVLIVPIIKDGKPTWNAYTLDEINTIKANAEDYAGEYLCEPSAGADVFFDRTTVDRLPTRAPIREVAGLKIFHAFNPSHRYGIGADVAGGVGLDSSASVIIDFSTIPARVVATYANNTIAPDVFGHELVRQGEMYGLPISAPENNKFDMCIGVLKMRDYPNIYFQEEKETRAGFPPRTKQYGWNTNSMTKPKMMFELKKAVEDGHLDLADEALKAELRSYARDDLMDRDEDARLTTRHFDLLIACAIALQMKDYATVKREVESNYQQGEYQLPGLG